MTAEAGARQRIDKWLFFARVVKSRSLAAKLAVGGKVRVNRDKIEQAAHQVKVGDVLTITLDRRILVYKIVAPGERRGPAPEAQLLYEDLRRRRRQLRRSCRRPQRRSARAAREGRPKGAARNGSFARKLTWTRCRRPLAAVMEIAHRTVLAKAFSKQKLSNEMLFQT